MTRVEWTPITIAVLALAGTLFTAWRSSTRKDPATRHIERADAVVDIQAGELVRIGVELEKARSRSEELESEIEDLRSAMRSMAGRMGRLESEVIRLGGDPALIL